METTNGAAISDDVCWRALTSRDKRFDGRFVTGVLTTGIYCRPGCPAPLPKRSSVCFFASPAAAESSGLRPCKRCRPDASPSAPVAVGTPVTVRRALRLLSEGGAADAGMEELAARLGVGARHLRRLFDRHVGAPPGAVARTERVHFARKLLEETSLSMTEVALAAGFGSVRRFNDAVRRTFDLTPSELRARRHGSVADTGVTLRLAYRPPLDVPSLLGFFAARATPGVEAVDLGERSYARTIAVAGGARGTLLARFDEAAPVVALTVRLDAPADLLGVVTRVRRMFDLDADPAAIDRQLSRDPLLRPRVAERRGMRVPGAWDPFELAVRAVLGQQVTVRGATTLAGRLADRFGAPLASDHDALARTFPERRTLARASVDEIAEIGVPRARAETLRALATAGAIEQVERGVGPWTLGYVAMRSGDPDAWPSGDGGLLRAAALPRADLDARAEAWRPWRAYAAMYLWSSLS